jgi:hypothetical protein
MQIIKVEKEYKMITTLTKQALFRGMAIALLMVGSSVVSAHHSPALFYNMDNRVALTGVVQRFNFRNPHAIVELIVTNEAGEEVEWLAETSAPSALRRRGWSRDSLIVGETVTLEGIQAIDDSRLMRITRATRPDGSVVGVSLELDD